MVGKTPRILITQCLQNDFVKPVGKFEPLPNLLHVGYEEAKRLMGDKPAEGPVARMMRWAYSGASGDLKIVHIRDWHDAEDPAQEQHLKRFGHHCLHDGVGARFAFEIPDASRGDVPVVNSRTLNDFAGTGLEEALRPFRGKPAKVGLMGVWTEAKITFLAYELRTRFPLFELGVCSALTASSSRAHHFMALEQLNKLLGVRIIPSMGQFVRFLGGDAGTMALEVPGKGEHPAVTIEGGAALPATDMKLLRYLFRDSKTVQCRSLDGGFSGNAVLGTESTDIHGHAQVAHVVKIGPQGPIGKERAAFERIESVLGNNAPHLADFADLADRGAIKYRYAAMGGGRSSTFQKLFCAGLSPAKTKKYLNAVFREQLGRLYQARTREKSNLLEYYWFKPEVGASVRRKVEEILGRAAVGRTLKLPGGKTCPNPVLFYREDLPELMELAEGSSYFSYVHGDLNGANIIIDGHENVWIIDFFHTHRGHVLKDLIKLENDLLYIFTPVRSQAALNEALRLTDALLGVEDLAKPLPSARQAGLKRSEIVRTWETIRLLRSFYPRLVGTDRDPLQLLIGQMRYSAHNLSFDESNIWQKRWALYATGQYGARIAERLRRSGPLRVDWIDKRHTAPGRLGITILPGRRDYDRDLARDVESLKKDKVTHVVCLITHPEFTHFGVDGLFKAYREAGIKQLHLPIFDQRVCSRKEMEGLVEWISEALSGGGGVAVHCVGGLGRSGTAVACFLRAAGCRADDAIVEVRRVRTQRAVESTLQEDFVRRFKP